MSPLNPNRRHPNNIRDHHEPARVSPNTTVNPINLNQVFMSESIIDDIIGNNIPRTTRHREPITTSEEHLPEFGTEPITPYRNTMQPQHTNTVQHIIQDDENNLNNYFNNLVTAGNEWISPQHVNTFLFGSLEPEIVQQ